MAVQMGRRRVFSTAIARENTVPSPIRAHNDEEPISYRLCKQSATRMNFHWRFRWAADAWTSVKSKARHPPSWCNRKHIAPSSMCEDMAGPWAPEGQWLAPVGTRSAFQTAEPYPRPNVVPANFGLVEGVSAQEHDRDWPFPQGAGKHVPAS